jgi:Rrf2 family protein
MSRVLNVSEAASLALHTLMLMASAAEKPLRVNEAAQALGASSNHLAKVLQRLVHARLATSTRGPSGGFLLARPASQISMLEVYETIDGPLDMHTCLLGRAKCHEGCKLGKFIARTAREFHSQLSGTRLSDVAGVIEREETK